MVLSSASLWAWAVVGVAVLAAGWHVWGITVTPERSYYWWMTTADLVVAGVAAALALRWPRYAHFEPDALVLSDGRIPYGSITGVRVGTVSAKPFWLAFWLPQSLVIGLIIASRRAEAFNRQVVELDTTSGPVRVRWRDFDRRVAFIDALQSHSDVEPSYGGGLDGGTLARDYTPRLSVGGGFLALGLVVWTFFAGLLGLQLLDRSTYSGPYSTEATSAAVRALTERLGDYPTLPGVPVEFRTRPCDRNNNTFLGPSPDVAALSLRLVGPDLPPDTIGTVEERLHDDAGMDPGLYYMRLDHPGTDVRIGIPTSDDLQIEVSTGCTDTAGHDLLRADLQALAAALGAGR
ncbi:hypothetical protein ALI22I_29070 [Saccharothrix sp. ALI-22-I]|nr:hypothetical protein ALI22I_29070 [Saccharothrix sp. ALI-22-I]